MNIYNLRLKYVRKKFANAALILLLNIIIQIILFDWLRKVPSNCLAIFAYYLTLSNIYIYIKKSVLHKTIIIVKDIYSRNRDILFWGRIQAEACISWGNTRGRSMCRAFISHLTIYNTDAKLLLLPFSVKKFHQSCSVSPT